jgi:Transcriptional regulators
MSERHRSAATIADIGRELGISAMTVSRALNGHPDVNEETRRKVLSHAARLNYRPNRWARTLVTKKSNIIGVVIPSISHSFFPEIIRAIEETIERRGYALMLCHTHADAVRERAAIEMLLGSCVDGLIVASMFPDYEAGVYASLLRDGVPFTLIDRYFPTLDCPRVRTDDVLVGWLATRHLIELGHTRIAMIRGPEVSTGRLREEGFVRAMRESGLEVREEYMVQGNFEFGGGYHAMRELLTRSERPTALFAGNDPSAIGAIRACREAGLDVPGDISIVGAGCIEGSYHPNPFLTTIDWSHQEMGEKAAELLLANIAREETTLARDWICRPRLVVRQSTGPVGTEPGAALH